jgi:subtilisin family serine protease
MPYRRISITIMVVALVGALLTALMPLTSAAPNERSRGGDAYIVVLDQEPTGGRGQDNSRGAAVREVARELGQAHGLAVTHVYEAALAGFAARVPNETALRQLKRDPRVLAVEPDRPLEFTAQTLPTGVDRIGGDVEQENRAPTAAGRPVAVIDSGIDATHPDLKGVVQGGYDCTTTQETWGHDGYGHGTSVSGIISALNNDIGVVGVAPGTPLYDVRVGDDAGAMFTSWTLCGLDWVTKNAAAYNIKVANMSFAGVAVTADHNACGPTTSALHNAICSLGAVGVTAVAAAGNDSKDANTAIPATYNEVTTVSALVDTDGCTGGKGNSLNVGRDDTRASFSNFGGDVDVAAPGVRTMSTVPVAQGEYRQRSGTSHATPHVTAAYALGWAGTEERRKGLPEGILKLSSNIGC